MVSTGRDLRACPLNPSFFKSDLLRNTGKAKPCNEMIYCVNREMPMA